LVTAKESEDTNKINSAQQELQRIQTELKKAKTELATAPQIPVNSNVIQGNQTNFNQPVQSLNQQLQSQGISNNIIPVIFPQNNLPSVNLERVSELSEGVEIPTESLNLKGNQVDGLLMEIINKISNIGNDLTRPNIQVSTATPLEDTLRIMSNNR
jgi:hypothetical protein